MTLIQVLRMSVAACLAFLVTGAVVLVLVLGGSAVISKLADLLSGGAE